MLHPGGVPDALAPFQGAKSFFPLLFRWSALRCDHRLLSNSPSGCLHRGPSAALIKDISRRTQFPPCRGVLSTLQQMNACDGEPNVVADAIRHGWEVVVLS